MQAIGSIVGSTVAVGSEVGAVVGAEVLDEELEPGATYGRSVIGLSPEHTENVEVAVALAQSICDVGPSLVMSVGFS